MRYSGSVLHHPLQRPITRADAAATTMVGVGLTPREWSDAPQEDLAAGKVMLAQRSRPLPTSKAGRALAVLCSLIALATACRNNPPPQTSPSDPARPLSEVSEPLEHEARAEDTKPALAPAYTRLDPESASLLEPIRYADPEGPAYLEVQAKLGPPVYEDSGARPYSSLPPPGRTFGELLLIHQHPRPPRPGVEAEPASSVVLDPRDGRVVAELSKVRAIQWTHGLALVDVPNDRRVHLLRADTGALVPAEPDPKGDEALRLDHDYWVRLSAIAPRVWIYAREREGAPVFLQEWARLDSPPPIPSNEFPFFPHEWRPGLKASALALDVEEVWPEDWDRYPTDCNGLALEPPLDHRCLAEDTLALGQGWRLDVSEAVAYAEAKQVGVDFQGLCDDSDEVRVNRRGSEPPRVTITCGDDPSRWFDWTPDDLRRLSGADARLVSAEPWRLHYRPSLRAFELSPGEDGAAKPADKLVMLDPTGAWELVTADFECLLPIRSGRDQHFVIQCLDDSERLRWTAVIARPQRQLARTKAMSVAVSPTGRVWSVQRGPQRDRVQELVLTP